MRDKIETALVYIYSVLPSRDFVGCGALIEGNYIATCRHVWCDAIDSESEETSESPEVEVEFPFADGDGAACRARLADACEGLDVRAPDLVLLKPLSTPSGPMRLQLATEAEFEIGDGQCHCGLKTRDTDGFIGGKISGRINAKGMRQFTGDNGKSYWMELGSSGSPVFVEKGQQLAGIIVLSEVGANEHASPLHEAFVLPATTIHKYFKALTDRLVATDQRSNSAEQQHVQPTNSPAIPFAHEADIEAVINHAAATFGKGDKKGALELLEAMIAKIKLEQEPHALPSSQSGVES